MLALLALPLTGGDLFDDYRDCPCQTRLRHGEIADLTLSRDSEVEDEVRAAWTITNPGNRRLGPMPARPPSWPSSTTTTSTRSPRPCPRVPASTFNQVKIGIKVTVQLAIVMETTDPDATAAGFQFTTEAIAGTMYSIGHNKNFGHYRSTDPDFVTAPATPRLRIGLAHAASETTWTSRSAA